MPHLLRLLRLAVPVPRDPRRIPPVHGPGHPTGGGRDDRQIVPTPAHVSGVHTQLSLPLTPSSHSDSLPVEYLKMEIVASVTSPWSEKVIGPDSPS